MTYREIISMLFASHVAIGVVLSVGLVAALWCWRLYRGLGPMTLRKELLHIGGGVATVAIGAVLDGASWQSVLSVSAIALLGAMGWNSSTSLPLVETVKAPAVPAIGPDAMAELERVVIEALRAKLAPAKAEPVPAEHVATSDTATPSPPTAPALPAPPADVPPVTLPTGATQELPKP